MACESPIEGVLRGKQVQGLPRLPCTAGRWVSAASRTPSGAACRPSDATPFSLQGKVAQTACMSACKHLATSLTQLLLEAEVRQLSLGALQQFSLDVAVCERKAPPGRGRAGRGTGCVELGTALESPVAGRALSTVSRAGLTPEHKRSLAPNDSPLGVPCTECSRLG